MRERDDDDDNGAPFCCSFDRSRMCRYVSDKILIQPPRLPFVVLQRNYLYSVVYYIYNKTDSFFHIQYHPHILLPPNHSERHTTGTNKNHMSS